MVVFNTIKLTASANFAMSMDVPPDQNTAPVLEFRCLYTTDTRRKQKRWQDGRLKYHTFNKRVMVFDERSNLVGDAHWREKASLDEGAELELERNGILVEVSEFIERKDQDLTELIDKRIKEREERFIARNGDLSQARSAASVIRSQSIAAAHLKPKPLNSILGTPSGHYGKALISDKSPFEQRQMLNSIDAGENESPRPTKRRKANEPQSSKNGFAQNLMGTTLSLTPTPSSTGPIRYESLKLKTIQRLESNDNKVKRSGNENTPSCRKQTLVGGMTRDTNPSESQTQSRKRYKPEKSGYASNLTGASLSLSSFRESTPRNVERNSTVQKNQPKAIDLSMDTSSDEATPPVPVFKPTEVIRNKKKPPANSERTSRLSSPPSEATPASKPVSKLPSKRQDSQNYASPLDQPTGRSHSSLRIKSRPRNKMLILMDQPSNRSFPISMEQGTNRSSYNLGSVISSAKFGSSSRSLSLAEEQQASKSTKLDPVLPAARSTWPHRRPVSNGEVTDWVNDNGNDELQMSAFPQNSLNDFEESSSSPADIGITHQTIDAILSRTRPPEAQKSTPNVASAFTEQGNLEHREHPRSYNNEEGLRQSELEYLSRLNKRITQTVGEHAQDHENTLQTSLKHVPDAPRNKEPEQISNYVGPNEGATSDWASRASKASQTRLEFAVRPLVGESGVTTVSDSINKPNTSDTNFVIASNPAGSISSAVRAPTSASCALQQTSTVPKATIHSEVATKNIPSNPAPNSITITPRPVIENAESAIGNAHEVSSNIVESDNILIGITSNGSTFNATSHFMAKLVPKPNQHRGEAVPIKATSSLIDQPATFLPIAQTSSNGVEIKQSPSSIPGIFPVEQTRSDEINGFMSANQVVEKDAQSRTSEASISGDQGLSRPRIINPATRGMSIQKTAKRTLHALAPAVNTMGPPAAIFGGLGGGRNTTDYTSGNSGSETSGKGPWSRESFDLFGSWRPPVPQS